jgi:uncharacterized glyoxalase superfamily protein PhnB
MQVVLAFPDEASFVPRPGIEVASPFEDAHWGTRETTVRDPDGRLWRLQAPGKPKA